MNENKNKYMTHPSDIVNKRYGDEVLRNWNCTFDPLVWLGNVGEIVTETRHVWHNKPSTWRQEKHEYSASWGINSMSLPNHSFPCSPDDIFIGGDLNLSDKNLWYMPRRLLQVKGDLDFRGVRPILDFPKHLVVEGNLFLNRVNLIGKMPETIVCKNLFLIGAIIDRLPFSLQVKNNIDMSFTTLEYNKFPNIDVNGNLLLRGSTIKVLNKFLEVSGILDVRETSITAFPEKCKNVKCTYTGNNP